MERKNVNYAHHRNKNRKYSLSNDVYKSRKSTPMPLTPTQKDRSRNLTAKKAIPNVKKGVSLPPPASSSSTAGSGSTRSRLASESAAHRSTIELLQNLTSIIIHTRNIPVLPTTSSQNSTTTSVQSTSLTLAEQEERSVKKDSLGSSSNPSFSGDATLECAVELIGESNTLECVPKINDSTKQSSMGDEILPSKLTTSEDSPEEQSDGNSVGAMTNMNQSNTLPASEVADSTGACTSDHGNDSHSLLVTKSTPLESSRPDNCIPDSSKQRKSAAEHGPELFSQLGGVEWTVDDNQPHANGQRIPQIFNQEAPQGFTQRSELVPSGHKELSSPFVVCSLDLIEESSESLESGVSLSPESCVQATSTERLLDEPSCQDKKEKPLLEPMAAMKQAIVSHSNIVASTINEAAESNDPVRHDKELDDKSVSDGVVPLPCLNEQVTRDGSSERSLQGAYGGTTSANHNNDAGECVQDKLLEKGTTSAQSPKRRNNPVAEKSGASSEGSTDGHVRLTSTSQSRSHGVSARASQARKLVAKSKAAVSLRQRQQVAMETEAPPTMTGITGPSTQGKTASNIASEGELSSGQDKAGKETVRKSQRITKGKRLLYVSDDQLTDEELSPTPAKRPRQSASQDHTHQLKGDFLAKILTDIPEVDICPLTSLSGTTTTPKRSLGASLSSKHHLKPSHARPYMRTKSPRVAGRRSNSRQSSLEEVAESPRHSPSGRSKPRLPHLSATRSMRDPTSSPGSAPSPEVGLQNGSIQTTPTQGGAIDDRVLEDSEESRTHFRVLMSWETDYLRGTKATRGPILYAMEKVPQQLHAIQGPWMNKAKFIWTTWRHKVTPSERKLYSKKAKENRKELYGKSKVILNIRRPPTAKVIVAQKQPVTKSSKRRHQHIPLKKQNQKDSQRRQRRGVEGHAKTKAKSKAKKDKTKLKLKNTLKADNNAKDESTVHSSNVNAPPPWSMEVSNGELQVDKVDDEMCAPGQSSQGQHLPMTVLASDSSTSSKRPALNERTFELSPHIGHTHSVGQQPLPTNHESASHRSSSAPSFESVAASATFASQPALVDEPLQALKVSIKATQHLSFPSAQPSVSRSDFKSIISPVTSSALNPAPAPSEATDATLPSSEELANFFTSLPPMPPVSPKQTNSPAVLLSTSKENSSGKDAAVTSNTSLCPTLLANTPTSALSLSPSLSSAQCSIITQAKLPSSTAHTSGATRSPSKQKASKPKPTPSSIYQQLIADKKIVPRKSKGSDKKKQKKSRKAAQTAVNLPPSKSPESERPASLARSLSADKSGVKRSSKQGLSSKLSAPLCATFPTFMIPQMPLGGGTDSSVVVSPMWMGQGSFSTPMPAVSHVPLPLSVSATYNNVSGGVNNAWPPHDRSFNEVAPKITVGNDPLNLNNSSSVSQAGTNVQSMSTFGFGNLQRGSFYNQSFRGMPLIPGSNCPSSSATSSVPMTSSVDMATSHLPRSRSSSTSGGNVCAGDKKQHHIKTKSSKAAKNHSQVIAHKPVACQSLGFQNRSPSDVLPIVASSQPQSTGYHDQSRNTVPVPLHPHHDHQLVQLGPRSTHVRYTSNNASAIPSTKNTPTSTSTKPTPMSPPTYLPINKHGRFRFPSVSSSGEPAMSLTGLLKTEVTSTSPTCISIAGIYSTTPNQIAPNSSPSIPVVTTAHSSTTAFSQDVNSLEYRKFVLKKVHQWNEQKKVIQGRRESGGAMSPLSVDNASLNSPSSEYSVVSPRQIFNPFHLGIASDTITTVGICNTPTPGSDVSSVAWSNSAIDSATKVTSPLMGTPKLLTVGPPVPVSEVVSPSPSVTSPVSDKTVPKSEPLSSPAISLITSDAIRTDSAVDENYNSSIVAPSVVFNAAFVGDISSMSRWELEQLYKHNVEKLEQQKKFISFLESRLKHVRQQHERLVAQKPTQSEVYQRFLSFVVEPETIADVPIVSSDRFGYGHLIKGPKNINFSEVIKGGTFDRPLLNKKYDFYASFR